MMSDFFSSGVPSIGDMRAHLQLLLDNKEKQLQQVGTLGQRILSQQVQLDERVRQLHELESELDDNQDLDSEIRERYRELTEMVRAWDTDNTQLTQSFDPKVRSFSRSCFDLARNSTRLTVQPVTNGTPSQASSRAADTPRDSERSKAGPSAAAQSRRAKNAAHRADDVGQCLVYGRLPWFHPYDVSFMQSLHLRLGAVSLPRFGGCKVCSGNATRPFRI